MAGKVSHERNRTEGGETLQVLHSPLVTIL